jgi:hypothetical protein
MRFYNPLGWVKETGIANASVPFSKGIGGM